MNCSTITDLHENIALSAIKFFKSLPKQGKPSPEKKEWTTMSAIVQAESDQNMKVVALGTGTRCLGQGEVSEKGDLISDSHAEIIARRSFLLYLYDQILQTLSHKGSILIPHQRDNNSHSSFTLKPEVQFHLFVSHVPCGDAAIFELNDSPEQDADEDSSSPTKKIKLDIVKHRTGAKLKVGENYEEEQALGKCRVKPGKGDPTLSMSCSDKIAKWQILGIQGSLLGSLIPDPITFKSIIIGGTVHSEISSLKRAIFDRFHQSLPDPLKVSHSCPSFHQSLSNFMDLSENDSPTPGSISCHWKGAAGKYITEVTINGRKQGVTKKNFGKPSSRANICRKNCFQLFTKIMSMLNSSGESPSPGTDPLGMMTYGEAKALNCKYHGAWRELKGSQEMSGWTTKPEKLMSFVARDDTDK